MMESLKISAIIRGGRGDDEEDAVMAWLDSLPKDKNGEPYKDTIQKHLSRALYQYVAHGMPKVPLSVNTKPIIKEPVSETRVAQQSSVAENPLQPAEGQQVISQTETRENEMHGEMDTSADSQGEEKIIKQDYKDLRQRISKSIRRVADGS